MRRPLDEQDKRILRAFIRDPRQSDNAVANIVDVNMRTAARRRQSLEEDGVLSFFAHVELGPTGTGQYPLRQMYTIKFKLGVTYQRLLDDIQREPKVRSVFTECILESHIAEMGGHLAMILIVEGESDQLLSQTMHEKIIPSLRRNHGHDCIEEIQTVRLLAPVRVLRNYVVPVNLKNGTLVKDWPEEAIYVGK